jgi:hypothetical protein
MAPHDAFNPEDHRPAGDGRTAKEEPGVSSRMQRFNFK